MLTLRLPDGEDPLPKMKDIVRFVSTVHAWAREGNLVDEGGFTQFGERGLFGRAHSGLLYSDARPNRGREIAGASARRRQWSTHRRCAWRAILAPIAC